MAGEPREEDTVMVALPADLRDWLDTRSTDLDLDRETILVQLVSSYRAAAELDGEGDVDDVPLDILGEQGLERVVDKAVDRALTERFSSRPADVQTELEERIETIEADFQEKIQDVRQRVLQVKREADAKAGPEHTHEEFERLKELDDLEEMRTLLAQLEGNLDDLAGDVEEIDSAHGEALGELRDDVTALEAELEDVSDRLKTVAWVVSDLREAYEDRGGIEAVDRIKRTAAAADIDRAKCENCGNGVELGLLTEPTCPHCEATVTNVEAASGFFGKPTLLAASQLESGEDG